MYVNADHYQL